MSDNIAARDIYEVANQLQGYVGPSTPEPLAKWLIREGEAAARLADEIVRLRAALAAAESRAQAAEVERDRLKKLLQPLADEAETWGPESTWGNSVELWQSPSRRTKITVGDARRAREALRGETK